MIASTRIDTNPNISPDGREIVFASNRRGNVDIWKANADGTTKNASRRIYPGGMNPRIRWDGMTPRPWETCRAPY